MKRAFDIAACIALTPTAILFGLLAAAAIRLSVGRPIFFRQFRRGRDGRLFRMLKFRTMRDPFDKRDRPLPDAQRLTLLGSWLRRTSLDELPQLWNVLKGDMSIVGPRPLLPEYLPRYTPFQRRRHEVKPGITGWAQVNGRNTLSWEHKFELDVWYVDHWSLWLDVKILWLTVFKVVRGEGVSRQGHATMPEFWGSPAQSRRDE